MSPRDSILELRRRIREAVGCQDACANALVLALVAGGHILEEGLPGWRAWSMRALAKTLASSFCRLQCSDDLLPSDITGEEVRSEKDGRETGEFRPGPIFHSLLLVNDLNLAPETTRTVVLEAMETGQVTVAGKSCQLTDLVFVYATQIPSDSTAGWPLTSTELDQFLVKVDLPPWNEVDHLEEFRRTTTQAPREPEPWIAEQAVLEARAEVSRVIVPAVTQHFIDVLVAAARQPEPFGAPLKRWIADGAGPRAPTALRKCAQAHAWLDGRDAATAEDVRSIARVCLRHRVTLTPEGIRQGVGVDDVVAELIRCAAEQLKT